MGKYLMLFGVAGLLVCFQNCSNGASFQAEGELVAKGDTLVAGDGTTTTPNTGDGTPTPGGGTAGGGTTPCCGATPPTTTPPSTTPPTTGYYPPGSGHNNPPSTTPPTTGYNPPSSGHNNGSGDCDNMGSGSTSSGSSGTAKAPTPDAAYVCVLRGNGSSQRIGLSANGLSGQVGTPRDVCMTENACLKIVSKKFDVKGAEKRGFCADKNPNVIPMTDSQIDASLALSTLKAQLATK